MIRVRLYIKIPWFLLNWYVLRIVPPFAKISDIRKKSVKWKLNEIKYNKKNEETSLASTCILPFRLFSLCWLYESSLLWVGLCRLITIKTPINPVKLTRKSKILVWQLWRWCHVIDAFSFAGLVITKLEAPIFMVLQSISYLSMDLNIVVILKNHQLSLVREWAE